MPYTPGMAVSLLFGPSVRIYPGQFTFSIPATGSVWTGYDSNREPTNLNYAVLGATQAQMFRDALWSWDELIAPDFEETDDLTSPGHVRVAVTDTNAFLQGAGAYAYTTASPSAPESAGDVWIYYRNLGLTTGTSDDAENLAQLRRVLVHEIGHVLGLNHPNEAPGFDLAYDTQQYSSLSGVWTGFTAFRMIARTTSNGQPTLAFDNVTILPTGPMVLDIAAVQSLYGADPDTRAGDTTYTWQDGALFYQGLYDAGGVDTFDLSANARGSIIDLTPGAYSSISLWSVEDQIRHWRATFPTMADQAEQMFRANLAHSQAYTWSNNLGIAFNTIIENVIGSAASDRITGNHVANILSGNGGDDFLYGMDGDDRLNGGAGNDLLDGGAGWDVADYSTTTAGVTVSLMIAGAQNTGGAGMDTLISIEEIVGSAFSDSLTGDAGANILRGGAGNDILRGNGGADILYGGDGFDIAVYSGLRLSETPDTLISIEEARFVDGTLTFDAASASAQVMRLYSATLNRTPDQGGLEANVTNLARFGIQGLAELFIGSAEFQARFGGLSNQQFIEQMYVFALGRQGDTAGVAGWVGSLDSGMSRSQIVVAFSESAEHQLRTAGTLGAGLWVPDAQAQVIARLYDATFDRLPDVGGLSVWTTLLKDGMNLDDIAAAFAGSAEFQQRYGALSNQAFVEQIYRASLDREGDIGGVAFWVASLNGGMSRAQVLLTFSESAEHIALTASSWLGGIRYAGYIEGAGVKASGAQILPSVFDDDVAYHPADLGLAPVADRDAFVLQTEATDMSAPLTLSAIDDAADILMIPAVQTSGGIDNLALIAFLDEDHSLMQDFAPLWTKPYDHESWA